MWRVVIVLSVAFALISSGGLARAQDPYACIDELSDEAVSYRIRKIERAFESGREKSLGWRIGWIVGQAGLFAGQVALAVNSARNNRPADQFAFAYGAAGAGALVLGLSLTPMPGVWGLKRIRRQADETPEERRAKLQHATHLLERGARVEGIFGSEKPVVASVVYGVVGGTLKAVRYTGKSPGLTALLFIGPPALALASTLTAPRHLRTSWEEYRGIACTETYYDVHEPGVEIDLGVGPSGVSFSVHF